MLKTQSFRTGGPKGKFLLGYYENVIDCLVPGKIPHTQTANISFPPDVIRSVFHSLF